MTWLTTVGHTHCGKTREGGTGGELGTRRGRGDYGTFQKGSTLESYVRLSRLDAIMLLKHTGDKGDRSKYLSREYRVYFESV